MILDQIMDQKKITIQDYHCYIEQPVKSEYGRQHGTTLMLNFQVFLVPLWLHKRTSLFTGETLPNNLG